MKRFPPGCWGPLMIGLGVVLMFASYWLGFATSVLNAKGPLTEGAHNAGSAGVWPSVFATGALLLLGGFFLMLVQGLLWIVHKAMKR